MPVFFKNNRIASYIRTGLTLMSESKDDWFHFDGKHYYGCGLGLAIAGKLGCEKGHQTFISNLSKNEGNAINTIAQILEIEPLLASEINQLHLLDVPAEEIAECLEFEIGEDILDSPTATT